MKYMNIWLPHCYLFYQVGTAMSFSCKAAFVFFCDLQMCYLEKLSVVSTSIFQVVRHTAHLIFHLICLFVQCKLDIFLLYLYYTQNGIHTECSDAHLKFQHLGGRSRLLWEILLTHPTWILGTDLWKSNRYFNS